MTITKNIISREEALKLCPEYVAFIEGKGSGAGNYIGRLLNDFGYDSQYLKKGREGITAVRSDSGKSFVYVQVKITSVSPCPHGENDGPVVRVGNGEYTWRVDGDKYVHFLPLGRLVALKAVDALISRRAARIIS